MTATVDAKRAEEIARDLRSDIDSDKIDLNYHERCRAVLPPGFVLYGCTFERGFSAIAPQGRGLTEFSHAAVVEFERLRACAEKAEHELAEVEEAVCLIYERCEQYPIMHEVEVQLGEVTRDMATDAEEPGMEGMPVYGLCDETIPLTEYEAVFSLPAVRRALERREEKQRT